MVIGIGGAESREKEKERGTKERSMQDQKCSCRKEIMQRFSALRSSDVG